MTLYVMFSSENKEKIMIISPGMHPKSSPSIFILVVGLISAVQRSNASIIIIVIIYDIVAVHSIIIGPDTLYILCIVDYNYKIHTPHTTHIILFM